MGESVWTPPSWSLPRLSKLSLLKWRSPSIRQPVNLCRVCARGVDTDGACDFRGAAGRKWHRRTKAVFALASLPADEQELHDAPIAVAKVSMQDIKLLRPEDVRPGVRTRICHKIA